MYTTVEMIATIARSRISGTFGEFVRLADGAARITISQGPDAGMTVIVNAIAEGWAVQFKGMQAIDRDIENAARMAIEAGRNVSVTRNYRI